MSEAQAVRIARAPPQASAGASVEERWLFVDGAHAFGGHEAMLLRWLEELHSQRSVQLFLLAREGSQLTKDAAEFATVSRLPKQGSGPLSRFASELRDMFVFARTLLALKPHLCIVAEGCLLSQPTFAFVARALGVRVVEYVPLVQTSVSMGFGSGRIRDAFVRHVYRRVLHGWITITKEQADDFRRWAGVKRPILTLPNTVARSIERALMASHPSSSSDHPLRVLVLGRIEAHQKGLDVLLQYAMAHPELGRHLRLTFVGSGPYEDELAKQLRHDTRLAAWVSMQGWSAPIDALSAHDVLLMTSRYEGVPLVMLEAMALGVPVVAPELDGIRAFIGSECLFPKGDMHAAFERIDRLRDAHHRAMIVARNRAEFERTASNAAFSVAVRALTPQLRALEKVQERSA